MSEDVKKVNSENPAEAVAGTEQTVAPAEKKAKKVDSVTKTEKVKKPAAIEEIITTIKNMSVLDLVGLIKALEAEFGITAAAPVVAAISAVPQTAEAAAPAEEKTEFNVILKEVGANKINVIKVVRELTALGLKESKDLVEAAPKPVREGVNKDEAKAAKEKLEAAGAKAEIT